MLNPPKAELFGLVRDAEGRPKIDVANANALHPSIKAELTETERVAFGVTINAEERELLRHGGVTV
jgi:hypothetical protein